MSEKDLCSDLPPSFRFWVLRRLPTISDLTTAVGPPAILDGYASLLTSKIWKRNVRLTKDLGL